MDRWPLQLFHVTNVLGEGAHSVYVLQQRPACCRVCVCLSLINAGSVVSVAAIDKLLQKWNSRFPHPKRDPVNVWDDIVTNRSVQGVPVLDCNEFDTLKFTVHSS